MEIKSENLRKYLIYNVNLKNENIINESDLLKLESIHISYFNNSLKEAIFYPEEIAYFENLREIYFSGFTITDDIIININKLTKLNTLIFNNCKIISNVRVNNNIKTLYMELSDSELLSIINKKTNVNKIYLEDVNNVDIKKLNEYENLEELTLLNSNLQNCFYLVYFRKLKKLKVIGCKLDNLEVIERMKYNQSNKIEITYSTKKYYKL